MSDDGFTRTETAIRFERVLPGPVDRVWTALTDPDELALWLMGPVAIEPRTGGAVSLGGGHIRGVVTQWTPGRMLALTWNIFAPGAEEYDYPESYLSFVIAPAGDTVRLVLTHRPMVAGFERSTLMGWHSFLDRLGALLRDETPAPTAVAMEQNRKRYGVGDLPPPPGRGA